MSLSPFELSLTQWLPNEYPRVLNMYTDYSLPPKRPDSATLEQSVNYNCYKSCYEQYHAIRAQIVAREKSQRIVAAQKIAEAQKALNVKYDDLLVKYQGLLQAFRAERAGNEQETAELLRLKKEMAKIRQILESVGLMV